MSKEMNIEAKAENLDKVIAFVDEHLVELNCPIKVQMQIELAVEEIFINISSYAYNPEIGPATIKASVEENPLAVSLTFIDNGVPYDPLAKEDPDTTLGAEERGIGGLGIFLVKQTMDDVRYVYKNGSNILTIKKTI